MSNGVYATILATCSLVGHSQMGSCTFKGQCLECLFLVAWW